MLRRTEVRLSAKLTRQSSWKGHGCCPNSLAYSLRRPFSTSLNRQHASPIDFPTPTIAKALRDNARSRIARIDKENEELPPYQELTLDNSITSAYNYRATLPPQLPIPTPSPIPPIYPHRDASRLTADPLVDSFRRKHDYLRISLTEQCNLRCFYCMPEEGIELSPKSHLLTDDEVIRLATLFVKSGVRKIRLTGGEPTVRKNIVDLVRRLSELRPLGLESIGMTTNGLALHRKLPDLIRHGLTHLNLSLDTLEPEKFEQITRRRGHEAVMKSLQVALEHESQRDPSSSSAPSLQSVKINAVVMKGLNEMEALDFVEMTRNSRLSVRFIEFMPFNGNNWNKDKLVPSSELLSSIMSKYPDAVKARDDLNDTARSYIIPGFRGSFGFISSMSDHFCSTCNRLRITADGEIKVCLFDAEEISLRDHMRTGATDEQLLRVIGFAVGNKKEKHAGMEDIDVIDNRPMIKIGATPPHMSPPSYLARLTQPTILSPATPMSSASRKVPLMFRSLSNHTISSTLHPILPSNLLSSPCTLSTSVTSPRKSFSTSSSVYSTPPNAPQQLPTLTHVDASGRPSMVDVTPKPITKRTAIASGRIYLPRMAFGLVCPDIPLHSTNQEPLGQATHSQPPNHTNDLARQQQSLLKAARKGPVLPTAQLAGIMAAKQTSSIIPLCHPLSLTHIHVDFTPEPNRLSVKCQVTVSCEGKTGVEMEALMGLNGALLCVWDMVKAVAGKEMTISDVMVTHKSGGKSGDFDRVE